MSDDFDGYAGLGKLKGMRCRERTDFLNSVFNRNGYESRQELRV